MEQVTATLSAVRSLRSYVGQLFEVLGTGVCADRETIFVHELQELSAAVSSALCDVELTASALPNQPGIFTLGNTAHLDQEISQDRQALYTQLVNSYKWTDKVHEYSGSATTLLSQNSLKRSFVNSVSGKRRRTSSHNVSPQTVDNVINTIDRLFNDMKITVSRPFVTNAEVKITLGRVLKAVLSFKGLLIEWVIVKGHGETLDLWTDSRYLVFRKVTENAQAAMLHYSSSFAPESALRLFMTWFHSLINLFSEPCKNCGKYLRNALPPTWRDFKTLEPFHEECKR